MADEIVALQSVLTRAKDSVENVFSSPTTRSYLEAPTTRPYLEAFSIASGILIDNLRANDPGITRPAVGALVPVAQAIVDRIAVAAHEKNLDQVFVCSRELFAALQRLPGGGVIRIPQPRPNPQPTPPGPNPPRSR
jgi:hypothetical protein